MPGKSGKVMTFEVCQGNDQNWENDTAATAVYCFSLFVCCVNKV